MVLPVPRGEALPVEQIEVAFGRQSFRGDLDALGAEHAVGAVDDVEAGNDVAGRGEILRREGMQPFLGRALGGGINDEAAAADVHEFMRAEAENGIGPFFPIAGLVDALFAAQEVGVQFAHGATGLPIAFPRCGMKRIRAVGADHVVGRNPARALFVAER